MAFFKWIKRSAKFAATLLIAASVFALYLIFTSSGIQIALQGFNAFSPYQLHFKEFKGSLAESIEISGFQLTGPHFSAQAEQLTLSWHLKDLLRSKKIQTLNASHLVVSYRSKEKVIFSSTSSPDSLVTFINRSTLFPIQIKNINLDQATIHWNAYTHEIDKLIINQTESSAKIQEISYQGAWGKLHASLNEGIKIQWDLHLEKNPYFTPYLNSALSTQGEIDLPNGIINAPSSKINARLQTKELHLEKKTLKDVSLKLQGSLNAHQANLHAIYNKAPIQIALQGKLEGKRWQGQIKELTLKHPNWQKFEKSTGTVLIDWHRNKIISSLSLLLGQQYPILVESEIAKKKPYALSGSVQTQIKNVKSLAAFFPLFNNLRGNLNVDLKLGGQFFAPQITGKAVLREAKVATSLLKNKPLIEQLDCTFLPSNKLMLSGNGTWGKGHFTLEGQGKLNPSPTIALKLKGKHLLLSDTPEYHILASPDLTLSLQNGAPVLEGQIYIDEALIQSLKNPDMISPSEDVVIISKKQPAKPITEQSRIHIATNLELILSDKISYKGHGFSSKVTGKLQIKQQAGELPKAKGKLVLKEGKYRAYSKTFDIAYGQILFIGGPIYDPILDIRAQRQINTLSNSLHSKTITAGMKFAGNLKTPKIELYSTPSLPDADIISYLIVGRPQHEINHAQAELLFEAVSQLAGLMNPSRKDVQFDLAERFKLDQFGFSKKDTFSPSSSHNPLQDTVFVLGKQLSDKLYLHYSVGILDSASQFGLRYSVGKNVMIEAQAGTNASSADVLLSFEGH